MNDLSHDLMDPIELRLARLVRAYTDVADMPIDAGAIARRSSRVRPRTDARLRWAIVGGLLALATAVALAVAFGRPAPSGLVLVTANDLIVAIDPDTGAHFGLVAGVNPVWSPDRTQIAFQHENATWVMSADGSGRNRLPQHLAGGSFTGPPVWSADGKRLLIATMESLALVDVDGGAERDLGMTTWKDSGTGSLTPDGRHLAIVLSPGVLYVIDISAEAGVQPALSEKVSLPWLPRWSPDGKLLAFADATSIHTSAVDTTGRRDYRGAWTNHAIQALDWSPDGSKLAYADRFGAAVVLDLATGQEARIFEPPSPDSPVASVAWSRDGSRLVVAVGDWDGSTSGKVSLWIVNADGTGARLIAHEIDWSWDRGPDWW